MSWLLIQSRKRLGEEIKNNEIDRSHRLGVPKSNGRYNTRCRIFKNKLKKDISVSESLTKERMEALKKARKDYGFENV